MINKMKTQMLPKEFIKMQKVAGLITESQLEEAFDFFKKKKSEPHTITLPKWQGKNNVTFTNSGEPYVSSDYVEFGRVGNGIDKIIFYYKTIGDKQNAAVYTGSNKQIYQLDPAESRRLISRYFSSNKNESQLEEVQSEYYQELVNNWKEQGLDYDAVVVELERMGFDEGTAQSLANKSYGEHEPEELSEVKQLIKKTLTELKDTDAKKVLTKTSKLDLFKVLKNKKVKSTLDDNDLKRLKEYLPKEEQDVIANMIMRTDDKVVNVSMPSSWQRGELSVDFLTISSEGEDNMSYQTEGIPRTLGKVFDYNNQKFRSF